MVKDEFDDAPHLARRAGWGEATQGKGGEGRAHLREGAGAGLGKGQPDIMSTGPFSNIKRLQRIAVDRQIIPIKI